MIRSRLVSAMRYRPLFAFPPPVCWRWKFPPGLRAFRRKNSRFLLRLAGRGKTSSTLIYPIHPPTLSTGDSDLSEDPTIYFAWMSRSFRIQLSWCISHRHCSACRTASRRRNLQSLRRSSSAESWHWRGSLLSRSRCSRNRYCRTLGRCEGTRP